MSTASETDSATRLWFSKAQQLGALVAHLGVDCNLRQERNTVAARHHLHDGRQARRAETRVGGVVLRAVRKGLIAQTVALFQQNQAARVDVACADAGALEKGIVGWRREQKVIFEQRQRSRSG